MPQAVTIRSLPRAFAMIKAMQDQGYKWGEDYRQSGRDVLAELLSKQVDEAIDRPPADAEARGEADRRNGTDRRHPVDRTGRYRAVGAAHAAVQRAERGARLSPAGAAH
jgi:hypothetical protein